MKNLFQGRAAPFEGSTTSTFKVLALYEDLCCDVSGFDCFVCFYTFA